MEYACDIANSKIVVVLGHTRCGAVISACNNIKSGHITGLLNKIKPAIDKEDTTRADRTGQNDVFVTNVSIINVRLIISQIREKSVILDKLEREGKILIIGGLYDIDNGKVTFFDSTF
jgi:carbonic anhydrase